MSQIYGNLPIDNVPFSIHPALGIGAFLLISAGVVYVALKHSDAKISSNKRENRTSLLSQSQLTNQLEKRNVNARNVRRDDNGYPASSRLRYSRKRFLK